MAAKVSEYVLDYGLSTLDAQATHIHIVDTDPTTFADLTTMSCGNKNFGVGGCFNAPVTSSGPAGRQVQAAAITDGVVTRTANASGWAAVDAVNSRLLANGPLGSVQAVTSGNSFQLSQFIVKLPSGA